MIVRTERLNNYKPVMAKELALFVQDYESIFRFSRSRLVHPETLMQHVGEVALISLFIVDMLNEQWKKCCPWDSFRYTDLFTETEIAAILRRALVHDLEEIVTGDIARPTKYSDNDLAYMIKKLESNAASAVIANYDLPIKWMGAWERAKEGDLGLIIKIADSLSVVLTCYREINLYSNNHFKPVKDEALAHINELEKKLLADRAELEEEDYENRFILRGLIDIVASSRELLKRYDQ